MKAVMTVLKPETVELTLTLTMPAGEWLTIRAALEGQGQSYWPCGKFAEVIRAAVAKIQHQVYVTESELT